MLWLLVALGIVWLVAAIRNHDYPNVWPFPRRPLVRMRLGKFRRSQWFHR